jgi:hypothetical protein
LLHNLQSAARSALPWRSWMADLARAQQAATDGVVERADLERQ